MEFLFILKIVFYILASIMICFIGGCILVSIILFTLEAARDKIEKYLAKREIEREIKGENK